MATIYKVDCPNRKPLFEGVQGENEARSIQFDITAWVEELGAGAVTATAKRPTDAQPYPVTIEQGDGNIVTWKPTSTDTAFEGVGSFQLEYTVDDVLAKTCIWSTQIAPSLDPAGDPPDPYDNWLASMREVAAAAQQSANDSAASVQQAAGEVTNAQTEVKNAEAWAVGTKGGVDVPSTDETYHNNAKYWAEKSNESQYGAYITKSASGSIASFTDGADNVPMKSLKVAIVPKQAGSGDPSPSNVRPISGTSTANISVTGTNVWDEVWEVGGMNSQTGENTAETDRIRSKNYIPVRPSTAYRIRANIGGCAVIFFNANKVRLDAIPIGMASGGTVFTTPSDCYFIRFNTYSNYGNTYNSDISINYPFTDTEYHTYTGHTTPVPLGQTVYGGSVNPISGELVIDKAGVDLGTLAWTLDASYSRFYATSIASLIKAPANNWTPITGAICSNYSVTDNNSTAQASHNNQFGVAANGRLDIRDVAYTTAAEFKTAMNGVMFAYPLKNPITVQLTPTEVRTILGTNNVWSDAGDVEVEYRADPTLAYAELQALILENN